MGSVERPAAHGAVERRVAEAEDAAVGGHHPVALAVGSRGHADDRRVEPQRARRPVEPRVAEAEDATVGGHQPVAVAVGRGGHADDGCVERARERPVVLRRAEGGDRAVGLDLPIPGPVAHRRDVDRSRRRLDRARHLAPGQRHVAGRRARTDQDGGDGAARVPGGRERRPHGEDRRAGGAVGELVQDDVAVAPALRQRRRGCRPSWSSTSRPSRRRTSSSSRPRAPTSDPRPRWSHRT